MTHYLTEAVDALPIYRTPEKILEIVIPTLYEKNNLPEDIRYLYCDIIEKHQQICHYENGIIDKKELIKVLRNDTARTR